MAIENDSCGCGMARARKPAWLRSRPDDTFHGVPVPFASALFNKLLFPRNLSPGILVSNRTAACSHARRTSSRRPLAATRAYQNPHLVPRRQGCIRLSPNVPRCCWASANSAPLHFLASADGEGRLRLRLVTSRPMVAQASTVRHRGPMSSLRDHAGRVPCLRPAVNSRGRSRSVPNEPEIVRAALRLHC